MAIKFKIGNRVGFKIKGVVNDAEGKEEAFDFDILDAHRLDEAALNAAQIALVEDAAKTGNHAAIADQLAAVFTNWAGVRDEDGAQIPYSEDALRALLKSYRGLGLMVWRTYCQESGAKEKN